MATDVVAYLAVSLDGFIAEADGGVAFLDDFGSDEYGYDEFIGGIAALVMGSATYEQVVGLGGPMATFRLWFSRVAISPLLMEPPSPSHRIGRGKQSDTSLWTLPVACGLLVVARSSLQRYKRESSTLWSCTSCLWPSGRASRCSRSRAKGRSR